MIFFLKKFFQSFRSTVSRTTLGATTLLMLTWFLWPDSNWQVHPDALAAFVVALLAWIGAEIPSNSSKLPLTVNKASPHDRQLFENFQKLLSDGEQDFLRTHDFGGSFSWTHLHGLKEIAGVWHGAKYEFDDNEIQKAFEPLTTNISDFIHALAMGTWPIGSSGLSTAVPDIERITEDTSSKTFEKVKRFNHTATQLYSDINQFIRTTRPIVFPE